MSCISDYCTGNHTESHSLQKLKCRPFPEYLLADAYFQVQSKISKMSQLPHSLSLSLFPPPCLSRVPVAMVIWHASRGGQMRPNGGGWRWLWSRAGCLINHNSNSWIVEYFVAVRHLPKHCRVHLSLGKLVSFFSCHRRHGDTLTLHSTSAAWQLVAFHSRLAPVKWDI